jgi:hypothetical protein
MGNTAGQFGAVAGGRDNSATGQHAAVPGGLLNVAAGNYSFAAGRSANANHPGAFVWGDSTEDSITSTGNNQFIVRASGGIWLGSTSTPAIPAGRFLSTSTGAHLTTGGTWTNNSDRALKENVKPVDGTEILERLAALPISLWSYKAEGSDVRHIGPMAQDFTAAFRVGGSDRHIGTVDADGVALAAIQALHSRLKEKEAEIETLKAGQFALEQRLRALEAAPSSK